MTYIKKPKSIILQTRNKWIMLYQRLQETENNLNELLKELL